MSRNQNDRLTHSIYWQSMMGSALALLLFVGLGGWAAVTEIESAVLAPGTVVVESSLKKVQHDTGGIVARINVWEGTLVRAGQVILRLDGERIAAEIAGLEKKLFDLGVRRLRLLAQVKGSSTLTLPDALKAMQKRHPETAEIIYVQSTLLAKKQGVLKAKIEQLEERIQQLALETSGLEELEKATEAELRIFRQELSGLKELSKKRLINSARHNTLKRAFAEKRGIYGRTIADIARTRGKITETKLQIVDLRGSSDSEAFKELEAIEGEMAQLKENLRVAKDQQKKLNIRASVDGHIHELTVRTIGGVIRAGDTLAYIVPADAKLVVDANVQPIDRDQIYPGMAARVRFTAFSQRTTPELYGRIERVASDLSRAQDGTQAYFQVRIVLKSGQINRLGTLKLVPGMPAETMMTAQPRTVLSYLVKPLSDQFNRAFRDD